MTFEPVHEMFHGTAERYPEEVAIETGDRSVTYRELAGRSNAVAAALRNAEVEPGSMVAVLTRDRPDLVASLVGVLDAACVFVPLDLELAVARVEDIVEQVSPRAWLIDPESIGLLERLPGGPSVDGATVIALGDELAPSAERDPREAGPDDPCYVYFTSGSSGRPKGIVGRLKAIDHFVRWEVETLDLGPGCRVSQLTAPTFDAFLRDVFVPLGIGGTLCVPPDRETVLDPVRLADWLDRREVELVHCTPTLFRGLLHQDLPADRLSSLRHVVLAGETLLPADVRRWHELFGDRIELINCYGPSETTMVKLFHRVRPEQDAAGQTVPIGRPMSGARAIVVDDGQRPCPPGKLGEIYIRTPYRSLGYLGQPELTREVFVPNPWGDDPEDLVYKTGDLGRLREDGSFEFVGRRDQQVKVRGVRVEILPIEEALRSHRVVDEAVVVDRTDTQGNKFLCAYVVLSREVDTGRLRDYLAERLPEAMVPAAFVQLESLPRTLSGKVDRRNLPDPGAAGRIGAGYVAPRTPVEESLCSLFAELLGLPKVGIRDSFFQLGGHSLLATQLLARIRALFGVEVPLGQVFKTPTVEDLALSVVALQARLEEDSEMEDLVSEVAALGDDALDEMLRDETRVGEPDEEVVSS